MLTVMPSYAPENYESTVETVQLAHRLARWIAAPLVAYSVVSGLLTGGAQFEEARSTANVIAATEDARNAVACSVSERPVTIDPYTNPAPGNPLVTSIRVPIHDDSTHRPSDRSLSDPLAARDHGFALSDFWLNYTQRASQTPPFFLVQRRFEPNNTSESPADTEFEVLVPISSGRLRQPGNYTANIGYYAEADATETDNLTGRSHRVAVTAERICGVLSYQVTRDGKLADIRFQQPQPPQTETIIDTLGTAA